MSRFRIHTNRLQVGVLLFWLGLILFSTLGGPYTTFWIFGQTLKFDLSTLSIWMPLFLFAVWLGRGSDQHARRSNAAEAVVLSAVVLNLWLPAQAGLYAVVGATLLGTWLGGVEESEFFGNQIHAVIKILGTVFIAAWLSWPELSSETSYWYGIAGSSLLLYTPISRDEVPRRRAFLTWISQLALTLGVCRSLEAQASSVHEPIAIWVFGALAIVQLTVASIEKNVGFGRSVWFSGLAYLAALLVSIEGLSTYAVWWFIGCSAPLVVLSEFSASRSLRWVAVAIPLSFPGTLGFAAFAGMQATYQGEALLLFAAALALAGLFYGRIVRRILEFSDRDLPKSDLIFWILIMGSLTAPWTGNPVLGWISVESYFHSWTGTLFPNLRVPSDLGPWTWTCLLFGFGGALGGSLNWKGAEVRLSTEAIVAVQKFLQRLGGWGERTSNQISAKVLARMFLGTYSILGSSGQKMAKVDRGALRLGHHVQGRFVNWNLFLAERIWNGSLQASLWMITATLITVFLLWVSLFHGGG